MGYKWCIPVKQKVACRLHINSRTDEHTISWEVISSDSCLFGWIINGWNAWKMGDKYNNDMIASFKWENNVEMSQPSEAAYLKIRSVLDNADQAIDTDSYQDVPELGDTRERSSVEKNL